MKWCKPHNLFYPDVICPRCTRRVVEDAGRLPLRVTAPQAWPRCHKCWNLSPCCFCDGGLAAPDDLPALTAPLGST